MIPEKSTVLLVAGVCAVVTGVGGGTTAPVNTASLPAPPPASGHCTASPRIATPNKSSDETITVHTTGGAQANLVVHYPTTTRAFTIIADSAGTAVITFPISPSTPGSPVQVDVTTNTGQACSTQFTPQ